MHCDMTDVTVHELRDGFRYSEGEDAFCCLFCGEAFERGMMYPVGERFADARKAAGLHVEAWHGSVFHMLLAEDKRSTGLTEAQKEVLARLYEGMSAGDIAKAVRISPATVRYQRFHFREKVKQAKMILALSVLLEEKGGGSDLAMPEIHGGATMVDERYMTDDAEAEKVARTFFLSREPLVLKSFPAKEKNKLVVLKIIAAQFMPGIKYAEKQVNGALKSVYDDYATLRRYLIEYGFMGRTADCGEYWRRVDGDGLSVVVGRE